MTEEKPKELLQKLVSTTHSTINEGLAKGTLKPDHVPYFRWKLTEFKYGDTGISKKSAKGKESLKPYWGRAALDTYQKVSKLKVYNDVFRAISNSYEIGEFQGDYYLRTLITEVAEDILEGKVKTSTDSDKYVISFLKDLNREEREYRTEVKLKGLILQPRLIHLDTNTILRKPIRKDFEREVPMIFPPLVREPLEDPTAFLHTIVYSKAPIMLPPIDNEITIFRLFRVGAVEDMQYSRFTDSVIHKAGGMLSRGRLLGPDKYLITREDIKPLKLFWLNMKKIKLPIPVREGKQKEPDELSIAYDRYSDSLDSGIIEKRIFSAVMGLEALYLGGGEQQEMSYRLRMRVAKLLGLIGYNQNEVREKVKDSYDIRSMYVHGGILKLKEKKKLEDKHGDLNEFTKVIMDYLRASIVALLKRPSKTSIIHKLDDSFLVSKHEDEVEKLLFMPYEKEVS